MAPNIPKGALKSFFWCLQGNEVGKLDALIFLTDQPVGSREFRKKRGWKVHVITTDERLSNCLTFALMLKRATQPIKGTFSLLHNRTASSSLTFSIKIALMASTISSFKHIRLVVLKEYSRCGCFRSWRMSLLEAPPWVLLLASPWVPLMRL